jgi:hypothetical protein
MMQIINIVHDLTTREWNTPVGSVTAEFGVLRFNFTKSSDTVFDNLQFGVEIILDNSVIHTYRFPSFPNRYIETDQEYLESVGISFLADKKYTINCWAQNENVISTKNYEFVVSKPASPYPSWIWEDNKWVPPTIAPSSNLSPTWNESNLSWDAESTSE